MIFDSQFHWMMCVEGSWVQATAGHQATTQCSTWLPLCSGSKKTSLHSAATQTEYRYSVTGTEQL